MIFHVFLNNQCHLMNLVRGMKRSTYNESYSVKIILLGIISKGCLTRNSVNSDSWTNTMMTRCSMFSWAWSRIRILIEGAFLHWGVFPEHYYAYGRENMHTEWCFKIILHINHDVILRMRMSVRRPLADKSQTKKFWNQKIFFRNLSKKVILNNVAPKKSRQQWYFTFSWIINVI